MQFAFNLKQTANLSAEDRRALQDYIACTPEHSLLTAEQEATATRDQLIVHNIRLVVSVAKCYAGRGVAIDDLIQEGNVGLMRAAATFNPARGRFSTYASNSIAAACCRAIADQSGVIRLPEHLSWCRPDTASPETRRKAKLARNPRDINGRIAEDGRTLAEVLAGTDNVEATAIDNIEARRILSAMEKLLPGEQELLMRRIRGATLQEIANDLLISKERVRQVLVTVQSRLKAILNGTDAPSPSNSAILSGTAPSCTCGTCNACRGRRWRAAHLELAKERNRAYMRRKRARAREEQTDV